MKYEYIGDPANDGEGPAYVMLYGHCFERGKPVEVTDALALAKLAGNGHFRLADEPVKRAYTRKPKVAENVENGE